MQKNYKELLLEKLAVDFDEDELFSRGEPGLTAREKALIGALTGGSVAAFIVGLQRKRALLPRFKNVLSRGIFDKVKEIVLRGNIKRVSLHGSKWMSEKKLKDILRKGAIVAGSAAGGGAVAGLEPVKRLTGLKNKLTQAMQRKSK